MFESAFRDPLLAAVTFVTRPMETVTRLWDARMFGREMRRPPCRYDVDGDWERRMHEHLGVAWPCAHCAEFRALWPQVLEPLQARGLRVGPLSFHSWNDGDPGLVRAIWCLIRHQRPSRVVETGVGRGFTSRFILEALERNGAGRLWSIDLPPVDRSSRSEVGLAVGDRFADRWSLILGSSRLRLPGLLRELGQVDLFVHDSMHSERNVRFELDRVWKVLKPGGAVVVDDMDVNYGFRSFTDEAEPALALVCEAEPIQPDPRRFNQKGLFGVAFKAAEAPTTH
jgi:hypothetical protein